MKKWLLVLLLLTLAGVAACSGSSEPVKVDSVTLARDNGSGSAGEAVTSFKPTDHIFHATVKLNRVDSGLKVKLSWMAAEVGEVKETEIDHNDFTAPTTNVIEGKVELPNDWQPGKYRLDIYLNDKLAQSVDFTVA